MEIAVQNEFLEFNAEKKLFEIRRVVTLYEINFEKGDAKIKESYVKVVEVVPP